MSSPNHLPDVKFYAGPMASKKTGELFSDIGRLIATQRKFFVCKPAHDIRDDLIRTRIMPEGTGHKAEVVNSLAEIDALALVERGVRLILGDEIQMFGFDRDRKPLHDVYRSTIRAWGKAGIEQVIVAGLDTAASGHEYSLFTDAHRFGANIVLLTASCEYPNPDGGPTCGQVARNSQIFSRSLNKAYRMSSLPDLLPEGDDPDRGYRAVCPEHYLSLDDSETIEFGSPVLLDLEEPSSEQLVFSHQLVVGSDIILTS